MGECLLYDTRTIRSAVANIWVPATKVWAKDHDFKNYRRTNRGEGYFLYRMADDREVSGYVKALEKGKQMFEYDIIITCSFHQTGQYTLLVYCWDNFETHGGLQPQGTTWNIYPIQI